MNTNDGGAAFPQLTNTGSATVHIDGSVVLDKELRGGMTLRQYYAGQAIVGLLSDSTIKDTPEGFARVAFQIADAMVKEGEKGEA